MFNFNFKQVFLLLSAFFIMLFLAGCGRDYTDSLNNYNSTINSAAETLTQYYDSLYDLNRDLYFEQRRRKVQVFKAQTNYDSYLINLGDNLDAMELEKNPKDNPLSVTSEDLDNLKKSINALALYSKDLVALYSDKLPEITYATINSMTADLKNVTAYTNYSDYSSSIAGAGNLLAEITKQILMEKRNAYIRTFVNQTDCIIRKYIDDLDKTNTNIQDTAKRAMVFYLGENDIPDYNHYFYQSAELFKNRKDNTSIETLRQIRLNNIEKQYNLYISLKQSDPKPLIKKLCEAQKELSDYVNGRTKDPKELLNTLLEIKTILSLINSAIP